MHWIITDLWYIFNPQDFRKSHTTVTKKNTHILPTFNVFFNQNDFKAPFFLEFVRKYNGNLLKTSQRPPSDVSIGL